ncbi:MAG TPA: hypothetical protein VKB55_05075 [Nocardioidaceae bacterium]|nr:hypothetical protein [Nocardioidaceae bacterium]
MTSHLTGAALGGCCDDIDAASAYGGVSPGHREARTETTLNREIVFDDLLAPVFGEPSESLAIPLYF